MENDKEEFLKKIVEFDDHFPDGVFAIPREDNEPKIKVRALINYCKEKKVEPKDLTEEEMARFIVKKTD